MHSYLYLNYLQVTHTLSVSLNKIGDFKYYEGDLKAARDHYFRALEVRRNAIKDSSKAPSQVSYRSTQFGWPKRHFFLFNLL